jgi:hypothetical protein
MRISVTRIAPRGGFSFAILAQTGLEPVQSFLTKGFSYHTCFYTSQLKDVLVYSKVSHLELFRHFCFSLSRCGLDYFTTILEILQVSI